METREIFEQMASRYDTEVRKANARMITNYIRTKITNTENKNLLDYGCGTGLIGLDLVNQFKPVYFMDIASNILR